MILDANALSDWAGARPEFLAVLPDYSDLVLPVTVFGEYLAGIYRSSQRDRLEHWLRETASRLTMAIIDRTVAERYAILVARQRDVGAQIPVNDSWVAAIAVELQLPVLSRDRHFDLVEGVRRIGW